LQLTADGKKLAVGYGDGGFKLWDVKSNHAILDVKAGDNPGHSQAIISLCPDSENNIFVTGSEDCKLKGEREMIY
jgi:angio-associated migratory cell protein